MHSFFPGTNEVYLPSMDIQRIRLRNLTFILERNFGGVIARLARAVDKSPNHMRVIFHPEKPGGRSIGEHLARQLEERLGLPRSVLDIEDENLYHSHICEAGNAASSSAATAPTGLLLSPRVYPLITWAQAAAWKTQPIKTGMTSQSWHVCHKDLGDRGFVLKVEDDSMLAPGLAWSFQPGMLLYINPDATAEVGQFVIVRRANSLIPMFRRLVLIDGERYLEACNPDWPKRYLPLDHQDSICGVVTHAALELP